MPDTTFEGETAVDQFVGAAPEGYADVTSLVDMVTNVTDSFVDTEWESIKARLVDLESDFTQGPGGPTLQATVDAMDDAVNNGIVPPGQAWRFFTWLLGTAGVLLIPTVGTYAFVSGYVTKWAQGNGWATLVGPPAPTPAVQALIQAEEVPPPGVTTAPGPGVTTAPTPSPPPAPLPVAPTAPVTLSKPTLGRQAVAGASTGLTGGTVPAGGAPDVSAAQVSAALNALATQVVELQAEVLDQMFPDMAPGQVPEALRQHNAAIGALENQMSQVRNGIWPRSYPAVLADLMDIAETLGGLQGQIDGLVAQMGEKADSALEDGIKAVEGTVTDLGTTVGTITAVTIPAIDSAVSAVTSRVGAVESDLSTNVEPRLSTVEGEATQAAAKLALTTDECLAQLCADQANVTDPIKQGGATPSLLKQLGNLLGKAFEWGALATLADGLLTILDAKAALTAVAKDTAVIETWATGAAAVIEADFAWSGGLDINLGTAGN